MERHWHQWPALPLPLVSNNMRTNLLIMGNFTRNFFPITVCGIYITVGRFMGLIWISLPWSTHQRSPLKEIHFMRPLFLVITGLTQPNNHIPKAQEQNPHWRRKLLRVLLGTPNQWSITGSNFNYSWWWKARTSAEKRDLSGIADPL